MTSGPTFKPFPGKALRGFVVFIQPTDQSRTAIDSAEYFLGHDRIGAATGGQHERIVYVENDQGQSFWFWNFPEGVPAEIQAFIDQAREYHR